jgi:peptide/nickel transport system ATP-binding protein
MHENSENTVLEVNNLKMYFPIRKGFFKKKVGEVKAVDGVSFKIHRGETLGLVGESGCGKTTISRCILRQYNITDGQIIFEGEDITNYDKKQLKNIRRKMSIILQDPYSSLNPRQNAGSIVGEPLKVHRIYITRDEYNEKIDNLFRLVGLGPSMTGRYPHEFSGGQRQRIGIARALACAPSLIVCDEPISALDVSIQAQIINLLKELQKRINGLSYLFIAHDLAVVRHISDWVAVMYLGRIVEVNSAKNIYKNPLHPYTQALLSAVPIADPFVEEKRERIVLRGEVPSPLNPPSGCTFHPRCDQAMPECKRLVPELTEIEKGHMVACLRV